MEKFESCPDCNGILKDLSSCVCGWKAYKSAKKPSKYKCKYCGNDAEHAKYEMCHRHYEEKIGWPNQLKQYPELVDFTNKMKKQEEKE